LLELAAEGSPMKGDATAWLLRNLAGEWAKYDLAEGLKKTGIYDPESITVNPSPLPEIPDGANRPDVVGILKLRGDPARGKVAAARCLICHQIDGNGAEYGPDLKGWAATQTRETLVRAIAEPSAEIALGYKGTEVLLKDGGVIHGIAFNNNDHNWDKAPPLVIQSAGGVTQLVPKERIEKKRELNRSLMYDPASLGLNAQDIADLVAWLQTYR
jgi:putative heme-binding domain-containing protein